MSEPTVRGIPEENLAGIRETFGDSPFDELVGLAWDLLSPDRIEAHLHVEERHRQPFGLVHGGVYATLIDSVGSFGAALRVYGDGKVPIGVGVSTDFLRSHREGRLDVEAEPLHVSRSWQLWQVSVTRPTDGAEVARGTVRLHHLEADEVR